MLFWKGGKKNNYQKLDETLQAYEEFNTLSLVEDGFLVLSDEVAALQKPKAKMIDRLHLIENELANLANIENNPLSLSQDSNFSLRVNTIKNESDQYKARRDTLALALKENETIKQKNQMQLEKELDEIKYEKKQEEDSKKLLYQLVTNQPISKSDLLISQTTPLFYLDKLC